MIETDELGPTVSDQPIPAPSCPFERPADSIRYPLDFELRVIYRREGEASIQADIAEATLRAGLIGSLVGEPKPAGLRWGKLSCSVSIPNKERMDALYTEIAKIASVKAAI